MLPEYISVSLENEIIETYWNVKEDLFLSYRRGRKEIIETYWNVKKTTALEERCSNSEIIETYWNVKEVRYSQGGNATCGNNRNILECKVKHLIIVVASDI